MPRGRGGFGYDPYFRLDELGQTFGEATRRGEGAGEPSRAGVSRAARALLRVRVAALTGCRFEAVATFAIAFGLAGRSVAWYRACFGSRRSPVQIRAPRPGRARERSRSLPREMKRQ